MISGLVAYPSKPTDLGSTICRALDRLHGDEQFRRILSREENDIAGRFIATEVLQSIEEGNALHKEGFDLLLIHRRPAGIHPRGEHAVELFKVE